MKKRDGFGRTLLDFDPKLNARVRAVFNRIVDEEFNGETAPLSRKTGFSNSLLSGVYRHNRGIGFTILMWLRSYTGKSLGELTGDMPASAGPLRGRSAMSVAARYARLFQVVPPEVIAKVVEEHSHLSQSENYSVDDWVEIIGEESAAFKAAS